jgi:DNA-binding NarL/FixJ family response regulator
VVVSDADNPDAMMEALSAGVRGYVPTTNTSLQVVIEVMHLVRAGGIFAPVTLSLTQQASARPPAPTQTPANCFTPRQAAVLEHLKRGSANKVIAHELSMSEGTVKVHVRNIMKKLRATNRTQAVTRAYNLAAGNPLDERQNAEASGIGAAGSGRPNLGS